MICKGLFVDWTQKAFLPIVPQSVGQTAKILPELAALFHLVRDRPKSLLGLFNFLGQNSLQEREESAGLSAGVRAGRAM